MATRDFSRVPSSQLDQLYRIAKDQPHLIPNAEERAAIIAEWEGRPAGASWGDPQPDNVAANLEASATPITPDPSVKPKAAKPKADKPKSAPPAAPKTGKQRMADVMAQGQFDNPQRGLRPGQSLEDYGREYRAALEQKRKEELAEVAARRAAGEQDPDQAAYNAETGVLGDTSLPPMDGYNEHTGRYETPRVLHPMIARDRALEQQHIEDTAGAIGAKYGPKNEAIYREWIRKGVVDFRATQSPAEAEASARWDKIENDARMSPDPEVRKAARDELKARDKRRTTGPQAENQRRRSADLKAEKDKRLAHWRAMTMLAGGSNNINAGNRGMFSQLAMLPDEAPAGGGMSPRQQQLAYALPGGRERAAADAAHNEQLTQLGLRVATGRGFQDLPPEMRQAQAKAAEEQAWAAGAERRATDEEALGSKYAPAGFFGYDEFTIAEQQQMVDDLVRAGYTPAQAQMAVDRQATKRRASQRAQWGGEGR